MLTHNTYQHRYSLIFRGDRIDTLARARIQTHTHTHTHTRAHARAHTHTYSPAAAKNIISVASSDNSRAALLAYDDLTPVLLLLQAPFGNSGDTSSSQSSFSTIKNPYLDQRFNEGPCSEVHRCATKMFPFFYSVILNLSFVPCLSNL
jgi:hypothetical protein